MEKADVGRDDEGVFRDKKGVACQNNFCLYGGLKSGACE